MKKIIGLCVAFLCAYQMSNAQTQKGTRNLGLNLNYSSTTSNGTRTNASIITQEGDTYKNFSLGPNISYFVADGMELGAGLSYNASSQSNSQTSSANYYYFKQQNSGYVASVFFRKYVLYQNKVGFRAGPYVGYGHGNIKSENINSNIESSYSDGVSNSFSAGANVDLIYYPTDKIGLAANLGSIGYNRTKTSNGNTGNSSSESFGFHTFNSGITLAMYYVLGAK